MIAPDIQLTDIDGRHWYHWYRLLVPPPLRLDARVGFLVLEEGRVIKFVVRGQGAVDAPMERLAPGAAGSAALEALARRMDLDLVIAVESALIRAVVAEIDGSLTLEMDFVGQCLCIVHVLERYRQQGIWTAPRLLELVPPVSHDALQRTFDMLIPDRSTLVAYVFEDDGSDVHASIIASKRRGHIDFATTHAAFGEAIPGPWLAEDWRRRHPRLIRTVSERRASKVAVAVFMERSAVERIILGPPDQLAREMSQRRVIIDPAPAWLLGLLGGATVAAVAGRSARALARMLPSSARKMASDLARGAQQAMRESGAHPFALLGFDPIERWHQVRRLYQPR